MQIMLDRFMSQAGYYHVVREYVTWASFKNELDKWLVARGRDPGPYTAALVARWLGPGQPIGLGANNVMIVGNTSKRFRQAQHYVLVGDKVRLTKPDAVN